MHGIGEVCVRKIIEQASLMHVNGDVCVRKTLLHNI